MRLTDSHCHLELKDFTSDAGIDEREEILARARAAGVVRFLCIGSGATIEQIDNAVAMAEQHDDVWAAVGIHPHDVARMPEGALARVKDLAMNHARVVAVGETGLDYHYNYSPPEEQQRFFAEFIRIARAAKKPLSLHIRDAHDDTRRILAEEHAPDIGGVVHCFTGSLDDAKRYVDLNFAISFSGIVTFKSAKDIQEAAKWVPADRILVETDCPYLAPIPMRGKRNEPAYVAHTVAFLAQLRGESPDALAETTSANADRIFPR